MLWVDKYRPKTHNQITHFYTPYESENINKIGAHVWSILELMHVLTIIEANL